MVSMDSWILSIKVFLISAGAVFLAMGIKLTAPIAANEFPVMWSTFLSWLKPPYLYIVINGIIIAIAALSRFHQPPAVRSEHSISVKTDPQPSVMIRTVEEAWADYESEGEEVVELKPVVLVNGSEGDFAVEEGIVVENKYESIMEDDDSQAKDVFVDDCTLPWSTMPQEILSPELIQFDYLLPAPEIPLVSSSSVRRKPIRAASGRVRSQRMPAELETLESTWKLITEGASRATPKAPHQEVQRVGRAQPSRDLVRAHVPKSMSFKDPRTSNLVESLPSFRIQKEPSPSQDELNRRVEEFIKKFNEDMRLQRQRSLDQHYKEMINSGV